MAIPAIAPGLRPWWPLDSGAEEVVSAGAFVAVGVEVVDLGAQVLLAAGGVATTGLGQDGLAALAAEPGGQGLEGVVDVVGHTLGAGAAVVRVEVLVDVED